MDKNKFLISVLVAVVGLLIILAPDTFIKLAVIILGVVAIADGIYIIRVLRPLLDDKKYARTMMIRGCLSIGIGALAVLLPLVFADALWTIMAYTLGAYLLVSSGLELYAIVLLRKDGAVIKRYVTEIAASIIVAVVLFIIPSSTARHIIAYICGIALVGTGLVLAFLEWKNKPIILEADDVRDDDSSK